MDNGIDCSTETDTASDIIEPAKNGNLRKRTRLPNMPMSKLRKAPTLFDSDDDDDDDDDFRKKPPRKIPVLLISDDDHHHFPDNKSVQPNTTNRRSSQKTRKLIHTKTIDQNSDCSSAPTEADGDSENAQQSNSKSLKERSSPVQKKISKKTPKIIKSDDDQNSKGFSVPIKTDPIDKTNGLFKDHTMSATKTVKDKGGHFNLSKIIPKSSTSVSNGEPNSKKMTPFIILPVNTPVRAISRRKSASTTEPSKIFKVPFPSSVNNMKMANSTDGNGASSSAIKKSTTSSSSMGHMNSSKRSKTATMISNDSRPSFSPSVNLPVSRSSRDSAKTITLRKTTTTTVTSEISNGPRPPTLNNVKIVNSSPIVSNGKKTTFKSIEQQASNNTTNNTSHEQVSLKDDDGHSTLSKRRKISSKSPERIQSVSSNEIAPPIIVSSSKVDNTVEPKITTVQKGGYASGIVNECGWCSQSFTAIKDLQEHGERDHNGQLFKCKKCGEEMKDAAKWKEHMYRHFHNQLTVRENNEPLVCGTCPKTFKNDIEALRKHLKDVHQQDKFQCHLCSLKYVRVNAYLTHLNVVHSPEAIQKQKSKNAKIEKKTKTVKDPLKCAMCQEQLETLELMAQHAHDHAEQLLSSMPYQRINEPGGTCETCNEQFKTIDNLHFHIKDKHREIKYHCEQCKYVCVTRAALQLHSNVHTDKYKCQICHQSHCSYESLRGHIQRVHIIKNLICSECDALFTNRNALWTHKQHHKKNQFKCDKCPYTTTHKIRFYNHNQTKSTCWKCQKDFCTHKLMYGHYKTVHGSPFTCPICTELPKFEFKNMESLDSHCRKNHVERTIYHCRDCKYESINSLHLRRHIESKHPQNSVDIENTKTTAEERRGIKYKIQQQSKILPFYPSLSNVPTSGLVQVTEKNQIVHYLTREKIKINIAPLKGDIAVTEIKIVSITNILPLTQTCLTTKPNQDSPPRVPIKTAQFVPQVTPPKGLRHLITRYAKTNNIQNYGRVTPELIESLLLCPEAGKKKNVTRKIRGQVCVLTNIPQAYVVKSKGTLLKKEKKKEKKKGKKDKELCSVICAHEDCKKIKWLTGDHSSFYCTAHDPVLKGKVLICKDMKNKDSNAIIVLKFTFGDNHRWSKKKEFHRISKELIEKKINREKHQNRKLAAYIQSRERLGNKVEFMRLFKTGILEPNILDNHFNSAKFVLTIAMVFDKTGHHELLHPETRWSHVVDNIQVLEFYRAKFIPSLRVNAIVPPSAIHSPGTVFLPVRNEEGHKIYGVVTIGEDGIQTLYTGVNVTSKGTLASCHNKFKYDFTMLGQHRRATGDVMTREFEVIPLGGVLSDRNAEAMSHHMFAIAAAYGCQFHSRRFIFINQSLIVPTDFAPMSLIMIEKMIFLMGIKLTLDDSLHDNPFFCT